jgi:hypothetical protein
MTNRVAKLMHNVVTVADFALAEENEDRLCTKEQCKNGVKWVVAVCIALVVFYLILAVVCPLTGYWLSSLFSGGDRTFWCLSSANSTSQMMYHCHEHPDDCPCMKVGFAVYLVIAAIVALVCGAVWLGYRCRRAIKPLDEITPLTALYVKSRVPTSNPSTPVYADYGATGDEMR